MRNYRYTIQFISVAAIVALAYLFKFNVEAFCPFGAIESMYAYLKEGRLLCALGTGNFFALAAVILVTLLFRRVFCGYICPIGAVSELMRFLAGDFKFKQITFSDKTERWLGRFRYIILAIVLFTTAWSVTLVFRSISPCYLFVSINDDVVLTTYIALAIVLISSFLFSMPFCRWFCPFAVILNLFSRFGLLRIRRNQHTCINCGQCAKACPMKLNVDKVADVCSAECIGCFECETVCPVRDNKTSAISWALPGKKVIRSPKKVILTSMILAFALVFLATYCIDINTYIYARDIDTPETVVKDNLTIEGVSCAGSAKLFVYYLNRKDISSIEGYVKVGMRPRAGWIDVDVWYDSELTDITSIIEAITEPYYDEEELRWRASPFKVEGYDLFEDFGLQENVE